MVEVEGQAGSMAGTMAPAQEPGVEGVSVEAEARAAVAEAMVSGLHRRCRTWLCHGYRHRNVGIG